MESKPREFWIQKGTPDVICDSEKESDECNDEYRSTSPIIHVIEAAAYESLALECAALKVENKFGPNWVTLKTHSALQADCLELVRAVANWKWNESDVDKHDKMKLIKQALEAFQAKNEWAKVGK